MILILKDNTKFDVSEGIIPGGVTVTMGSYAEIASLEEALTVPGNLDIVTLEEMSAKNLALLTDLSFSVMRKKNKIHVTFELRQKTEAEIALEAAEQEQAEQQENIITALTYLTDQEALTVIPLHQKWEDDPDGYHYSMSNPEDARRQHGGALWKLQKDHDKQTNWYPGNDPTLWVQIIPEHSGTMEDPIPVPDSVETSGFEYVYGKYYSEGETIYLCQRQGVEDPESLYGQAEKLYAAPSVLVGQYFIIAE